MNRYVLFVCVWCLCGIAAGNELIVRHPRPTSARDQRNAYFMDMLRLALNQTVGEHGPFTLREAEHAMPQGRAMANLRRGIHLDVLWTMTSKEREVGLRPVRIPLLKGLLGHRVFLIREGDQERFRSVTALTELTKLKAGQGHDWPDTGILRANGIPVVTSRYYAGLFIMLRRNRFDYFPRGVNEAWGEAKAHEGIVVEETLLLQYYAPIYFFVNASNVALAERLERGLRLALTDGEFDRLFFDHPANKEIFETANLKRRRLLKLENPQLPEETPLGEKALWYTP
ncbi:hypothetical protein ACFL59_04320 [Planctomycetota bacterium]